MFACVHWTGMGFDQEVLKRVPDRALACFFLPQAILCRVPDVAAFTTLRDSLTTFADQNATFRFIISAHTTRDTFGGHSTFQLPPNFDQIVGP